MPDERWTDEFLNQLREAGDPDADDAIAEVSATGQEEAARQGLIGLRPQQRRDPQRPATKPGDDRGAAGVHP
ncbi:hypothetical protein [Saccharopolyspora spinosa]|uniref:Uncharacterized protein n=1 Tax=Saccharopolyspora spinosa TaxID=60894 RepID=A0A2N3XVX4_SACSN|nr:hypothetical protein [Saccharopolyspora spinosa]PKW14760.1 hypothetical protein A8926_2407 [Saccharopolyspora spinosa]